MTDKHNFRGLIIPLATPYLENGDLDIEVLEQLVEFYLSKGVHGFFALGSFGMGAATPMEQRKQVAEIVIKTTRHRIPTMIQIGSPDPYASIELGRHARAIGAEAVAMVGPYYYSDRSEWEIIEHYKMVDREVGLPMLVYNNAAYSGYDIAPSMMAKLVEEIPKLFGSKLADGDLTQAQRYMKRLPDFSIFIPAQFLFPGMLTGTKGSISPPLASYPELGVRLIKAIDDRDWATATALQVKLFEFANVRAGLSAKYGRSVFTETMRLRGIGVKRYPRWPTRPWTGEDREALKQGLQKAGVPL